MLGMTFSRPKISNISFHKKEFVLAAEVCRSYLPSITYLNILLLKHFFALPGNYPVLIEILSRIN